MVFDKTGTLTHGKPKVTSVTMFTDLTKLPFKLFLALIGTAEANSEHPLAKAVKDYAMEVTYVLFLDFVQNIAVLFYQGRIVHSCFCLAFAKIIIETV